MNINKLHENIKKSKNRLNEHNFLKINKCVNKTDKQIFDMNFAQRNIHHITFYDFIISYL